MVNLLTRRAQSAGAYLTGHYPSSYKPLAEPPPGSGLQPVLGKAGPPIIGYAPLIYDQLRWARKTFDEVGPVSWSGMLGTKVVGLMGPDALEAAWANRDKAISNELGFDYFTGPFFKRGLLMLDFDEHMHHRRIMQQAFTRDRLASYLDLMKPGIAREISAWEPGYRFPYYSSAKMALLHLATEVFVGTTIDSESERIEHAFIDAVRATQSYVRAPMPGGHWSAGLKGRRVLEAYFRNKIPSKRATGGNDLFSVLCSVESEGGHRFSDDDVVNHMIFVMMAAHDTSAITLSTMTYLLARHPEWQDRLRDEARALGKPALDYDDVEQQQSLDLVFKETTRMYAPAGALPRETVKDTEILGHYIPAGTKLMIQPFNSMRLERWWPNPDRFDPERFADHRREDKVHRIAWAPFGAGAHKCIGMYFGRMTVKAIMHQMLLKYRWSVPDGYRMPIAWGTGPIPNDGLPIQLTKL